MDCFQEPALYVGEIEEDIDIYSPPVSGEEYIKRVILEARQCDDVVVAEIDKNKFKKPTINIQPLTGCIAAPAYLIPTQEWQEYQVKDFSKIRLYIAHLRSTKQLFKFCNAVKLPDVDDEKAWINICSSGDEEKWYISPKLGLVLSMNQPLVERVLEYLVNDIKQQNVIEHKVGRWIYALLVALEVPLNPDTCSCLRLLARYCSVIRINLNSSDSPMMGTLNLFICLVARYFRQLDLVDR